MIQRIQTLYLILVASLMMSMLFLPFGQLGTAVASYTWSAEGISTIGDSPELTQPIWSIFILLMLTTILPVVTIFLYKKRLLQVRICVFNTILIVSFYVALIAYWYMVKDALSITTYSLSSYLVMPIVAIVLNYISIRKILQDEVLVRSLDRIR